MRILFVCTGNLCRSPLAEGLALAWARESLANSPELAVVDISSAGLAAVPGREMDPHAAEALRRHEAPHPVFRSRPFSSELAEDADLVFTMTRDQRSAVLRAVPRGLRRTFTLTEAAALLSHADRTGLALMPLTSRARELGRRLDVARAGRTTSDQDDTPDPVGKTAAMHDSVAVRVATALRPLADVLFTSVRSELRTPEPV
ncbi:hypothetical protein [Geodermatophilus sp. CPCC 206100]|uniref:arsenate reductase/protein-tyrosine-phosphatase family protein n=1 Tax=Geodermatophilus sp. CPCC 206100 TaxID=3020054 RepID=UPI003AFFF127